MLSDPLAITYNGTAKSLPRASMGKRTMGNLTGTSSYATSDGEFFVLTRRFSLGKSGNRTEVLLARRVPDSDGNPFNGTTDEMWANAVGLVFETNVSQYQSSTDIPLLRSALLSLVDSTLQGRLIGGEL